MEKFQPGMKISNFLYNRHFFQPGMKIWYCATSNSFLILLKNKDGNFTSMFQMDQLQTYQSYKMFTRFKSFMEFRNFNSTADKAKSYENLRKGLLDISSLESLYI